MTNKRTELKARNVHHEILKKHWVKILIAVAITLASGGFFWYFIPALPSLKIPDVSDIPPDANKARDQLLDLYKQAKENIVSAYVDINVYFETIYSRTTIAVSILITLLTGFVSYIILILFFLMDRAVALEADLEVSLDENSTNIEKLTNKLQNLAPEHNIIAYDPIEVNRFVNVKKLQNLPDWNFNHLIKDFESEGRSVLSFLYEDNFENLLLSEGYIKKFTTAADLMNQEGSCRKQYRVVITNKTDSDEGLKIFAELSEAMKYETMFISSAKVNQLAQEVVNDFRKRDQVDGNATSISELEHHQLLRYVWGQANVGINKLDLLDDIDDKRWQSDKTLLKFKIEWLNELGKMKRITVVNGDIEGDLAFTFLLGKALLKHHANSRGQVSDAGIYLDALNESATATLVETLVDDMSKLL